MLFKLSNRNSNLALTRYFNPALNFEQLGPGHRGQFCGQVVLRFCRFIPAELVTTHNTKWRLDMVVWAQYFSIIFS